ncbi:hypothetical protein ABZ135_13165 [Streptomyces sp. NPDC006339]|uniref:hypothetical protein n=1 Tax=Streptomyces sp. NPDC006339 TaxID=3156755 RepID=UPI0033A95704
MFTSSVRSTAVAVIALAALCVSCGADPSTDRPQAVTTTVATVPTSAADAASDAASAEASAGVTPPPTAPDVAPPERVRDAFAGLQATLGDACTPGNCAYFLGRVYDELHRLDRAMKADPKGAGHFARPIELIARLDAELAGDRSFENLKRHQTLLVGTRDRINTWMQGHPDDYR